MSRNQWKNITIGLGVAFVSAFLIQAQSLPPPPTKQAASPQQPAPAQTPPAPGKTIFDYKADLSLSDKQEQDIRQILEELNRELRLGNARLTLLNADLEDLVKSDGDLEQIKKKLKEAYDMQANLRFSDISATRRINRVLSPEQLKRWRGIQAAAREQK